MQRAEHRERFLHEDEMHCDQQRTHCQPQVSQLEGNNCYIYKASHLQQLHTQNEIITL